jgi:hypothetical protein
MAWVQRCHFTDRFAYFRERSEGALGLRVAVLISGGVGSSPGVDDDAPRLRRCLCRLPQRIVR